MQDLVQVKELSTSNAALQEWMNDQQQAAGSGLVKPIKITKRHMIDFLVKTSSATGRELYIAKTIRELLAMQVCSFLRDQHSLCPYTLAVMQIPSSGALRLSSLLSKVHALHNDSENPGLRREVLDDLNQTDMDVVCGDALQHLQNGMPLSCYGQLQRLIQILQGLAKLGLKL